MPTSEAVTVPLDVDAQAAYDRARALASAWQAFADRLAHELGDDLCTHPPGMRSPMTEERSFCGLCGRQFLN